MNPTTINTKTGYKKTKLGWIPEEWKIDRLGGYIKIQSGESPSKFAEGKEGISYIKVDDLNNCLKYQVNGKFCVVEINNFIEPSSIIFPKRGAAILNNKVRITKSPVFMDSNLMALTLVAKDIETEYLYYHISYRKLFKIADTSTIPQINNKHIVPLKIPIPPLPEQKAIAQCLSTWDAAISKLTALIQAKEKQKKGWMQRLLTGKERLPRFSGAWIKLSAGKIFESISIKKHPSERLLSVTQDKGVIPRDMLDARVTMPKGKLDSFKLVNKGNFVISLRSFQGGLEYSDYRGLVSPAYTVLKERKEIDQDFYKYYFKSYEFIERLSIAVIGIRDGKQISYSDFCTVKIPFLTLEEQTAIAQVLTTADKEITLLTQQLTQLQKQKKGLMQQLLTGRKRLKV